jgi:hypothetical protein
MAEARAGGSGGSPDFTEGGINNSGRPAGGRVEERSAVSAQRSAQSGPALLFNNSLTNLQRWPDGGRP